MSSRRQQAGSVVTYAIIGFLLAAAAVIAIVTVRNWGEADKITTPPVAQETKEPRETASRDDASDKEAEKEAAQAKEEEQKKAAAAKEAEEAEARAQAEREAEVAAEQQAASDAANASTPMASSDQQVATAELPTTGPLQDLLGMVIGMIAIAGAGYFYYHYGTKRPTTDEQ